jgi:hypothetical protein
MLVVKHRRWRVAPRRLLLRRSVERRRRSTTITTARAFLPAALPPLLLLPLLHRARSLSSHLLDSERGAG